MGCSLSGAEGKYVTDYRPGRLLKNVGEAGRTRQKEPKMRSLVVLNEHSEAAFNDVLPTQVVFKQPA
jgi:hypothetical protein